MDTVHNQLSWRQFGLNVNSSWKRHRDSKATSHVNGRFYSTVRLIHQCESKQVLIFSSPRRKWSSEMRASDCWFALANLTTALETYISFTSTLVALIQLNSWNSASMADLTGLLSFDTWRNFCTNLNPIVSWNDGFRCLPLKFYSCGFSAVSPPFALKIENACDASLWR